jgi:hypothetical protein
MKTSATLSRPSSLIIGLIALAISSTAWARVSLEPTYTATMVESEFKRLDDINPSKLTGIWLVQFLPGEALRFILNGEIMIEGYWVLNDNVLTLTRMSGTLVCPYDRADIAVYRVSIRGFSVSFEKEEDECPERAAVLTRGVFRATAS